MTQERIVDIKFINTDDQHKYVDTSTNEEYISVTTLIDKYTDDYDSEYWAVYRSLDQAKYKLVPNTKSRKIGIMFGTTKFDLSIPQIKKNIKSGTINVGKPYDVVLEEWRLNAEEACAIGSEKHDYLESCINEFYGDGEDVKAISDLIPRQRYENNPFDFVFAIRTIEDIDNSPLKNSDPKVYHVLTSAINAGYVLYAEVRVYSSQFKVCGTIDVFAVKDKTFVIIDWKTNKDPLKFYSGYYKKVWNADRTEKIKTDEWVAKDDRFKKPLNHLQKCKGNIYTIQLSLYAALAELWGYQCKGLVLCHLLGVRNPGAETVIYGNIKYLKKEAIDLLSDHRDKTNKVFRRTIK